MWGLGGAELVRLVRLSALMVLPDGGFGQWGVENTRHILRLFQKGSVIIDINVIAFLPELYA
jgi:hypothetical protein